MALSTESERAASPSQTVLSRPSGPRATASSLTVVQGASIAAGLIAAVLVALIAGALLEQWIFGRPIGASWPIAHLIACIGVWMAAVRVEGTRTARSVCTGLSIVVAWIGGNALGEGPIGQIPFFEDSALRSFFARQELLRGIGGTVAVTAFYVRFRTPFAIVPLAVSLHLVASNAQHAFGVFGWAAAPVYLACGAILFAVATWVDLSDPARTTDRSAHAFWLHLVAAALLLHWPNLDDIWGYAIRPFWVSYLPPTDADAAAFTACTLLGVVIALLLDRRIYAVAVVPYAVQLFAWLVFAWRLPNLDLALASVALLTGVFVVALVVGWRTLRRRLLALLPSHYVARLSPVA